MAIPSMIHADGCGIASTAGISCWSSFASVDLVVFLSEPSALANAQGRHFFLSQMRLLQQRISEEDHCTLQHCRKKLIVANYFYTSLFGLCNRGGLLDGKKIGAILSSLYGDTVYSVRRTSA